MKLDTSKLREKLTELKAKAVNMMKLTLTMAVRITATTAAIASLIYISARAPELHSMYLRSKVGSRAYLIYEPHVGGGSGFAIKAPSGETYIVTNDHVCAASKDGNSLMVKDDDGMRMRRRIIARSEYSDLCLLEGVPGVEGLEMAAHAPAIGQVITSVGHPAGYNLTTSKGEVIQKQDVAIPEGPISVKNPQTGEEVQIPPEEGGITPEQCSLPKNRIATQQIQILFFVLEVKFCLNVTEGAYFTNMLIQPGSSGSAAVDFWGDVVGVMFASDEAHWGVAVSHTDLTDFLKPY